MTKMPSNEKRWPFFDGCGNRSSLPVLLVPMACIVGCPQARNEAPPGAASPAVSTPPPPTSPGATSDMPDPPPTTIGSATMTADGTLEITLRATDDTGIRGDAFLRIPPDHEDYAMWLRHLGGLKPGESKFVPPFPE